MNKELPVTGDKATYIINGETLTGTILAMDGSRNYQVTHVVTIGPLLEITETVWITPEQLVIE